MGRPNKIPNSLVTYSVDLGSRRPYDLYSGYEDFNVNVQAEVEVGVKFEILGTLFPTT